MFKGFSYMFLVVSRVFWLFQGCSYMFPICLKGVPRYFNNVSIVSYMLKEYLKGVPVVSRLFQGFSYMFLYVFLIKLFLVVSGSLNCFWLFFYMFPICSYFGYSVFRHFWAFLGGFMTSMVFFTFLYI